MQTPESGYDNQYEERGFTAVPQNNAPQAAYPPQPAQGYQQPYYAQPGYPPQGGQGAVPPTGYAVPQQPYQQPYQPVPQQPQPQNL